MIEVVRTGPYAALQDLGRPGLRHLGVSGSGAADRRSHRLANALVGNDDSCPTIEILGGGLSVRLRAAATIALTGARCPVPDRKGLEWATPVSLPAGSTVTLGAPPSGLLSYLAVRGGFDVPPVLGSRATDSMSGLGPSPLRAGDLLAAGRAVDGEPLDPPIPVVADRGHGPPLIRIRTGPRADWLSDPDWTRLLGTPWRVDPRSNRIGVRLAGPTLDRRPGELASEAAVPGAVQIPPDGRPIILGPDGPVTGGYPVVAVVELPDLDRLAQLRPGDALRLRLVD